MDILRCINSDWEFLNCSGRVYLKNFLNCFIIYNYRKFIESWDNMDTIKIKCPAKINLSLDVVGKRQDGYHLVKMLMQSISLFDEVTVEQGITGIKIFSENSSIPCDETNTVHKAAKLIMDKYEITGGVNIYIKKRIPVAAGLAGGSTDAAGTIFALNELFNINMKIEDMREVGLKVGADVPFCMSGGTALAEGIGEILTPLKPLVESWCVIAKPPVDVSTKKVYSMLKIDEIPKHPETDRLIEYIKRDDIKNLSLNMINVLENVTINMHPVIFEIKNIMMDCNALGSIMSGSGPSVFGLFDNKNEAEKCYNRLRDYLKEVYFVKTFSGGVFING